MKKTNIKVISKWEAISGGGAKEGLYEALLGFQHYYLEAGAKSYEILEDVNEPLVYWTICVCNSIDEYKSFISFKHSKWDHWEGLAVCHGVCIGTSFTKKLKL